MFKVIKSKKNINPFGGIYFINDTLSIRKVDKIIDRELGSRAINAEYSYSEGIKTLFYSQLSGGSCFENINTIGDKFNKSGKMKLYSHDTISVMSDELEDTTWVYTTKSGIELEINSKSRLNRLLSVVVKAHKADKTQC
jgi:hypothetical protein